MRTKTIGIIGAGKLGMVLAQLALKAGFSVYISGSGEPENIKLAVSALAPGAIAANNEAVVRNTDVVILAIPLGKFRQIPADLLVDKLVIDATNYWWEVDGPREAILPNNQSTSEAIQEYFSSASIVKALSHMGYHHLHDEPRLAGETERKAIAIAGDDINDITIVSNIVDSFGFDPLHIGDLAEGSKLEPASPAFGANTGKQELRKLTNTLG